MASRDETGKEPAAATTAHIRPRVRSRKVTLVDNKSVGKTDAGAGAAEAATAVPPTKTATNTETEQSGTTKGILKTPKYTKKLVQAAASTAAEVLEHDDNDGEAQDSSTPPTADVPIVQDVIVERKPQRKRRGNKSQNNKKTQLFPTSEQLQQQAKAIEGYVPADSDNAANKPSGDKGDGEENLVFNSLADLMDKAGTLPDDKASLGDAGTVIEADLEFRVFSPEEFAEQLQIQEDGLDDDEGEEDNTEGPNPAEDNDEDDDKENSDKDDSFWDLLNEDGEDEDEPVLTRPERCFLQLWKALSQWVTPEAAAYVVRQQENGESEDYSPKHRDWSDIESTRCAGLMSLLQMYLGSCLEDDLHRPLEERRTVEQRLGHLIRCFDYAQPSPPLGASQARALTCILLQTVHPQHYQSIGSNTALPTSCQAVGLTVEEHRYLVQSAIANFQS